MEAPVTANELAARRINDLTKNIKELNDNIKEYDKWIRDEENKPEKDQKKESIKEWRETIKEWREDKAFLRKALDLEIERERASLEKRFSNLSVDDPGFLHFLLFVLGF
jgi:biopolymer transport protein ExbB/TolQ